MDQLRFDAVVKRFAEPCSRRSFVKLLVGGALGVLGLTQRTDAWAAPSGKITLCHKPGNAQHSITVASSAVAAHLKHGDYVNSAGCCPANTVVVRHENGAADCCTPKTMCQVDDCGDIDDGCGGVLSCAPCPVGCTAVYQVSGLSTTQITGEICDIRNEAGEPGPNAVCTCGCPDGFAHCAGENPVGDPLNPRIIITASCCPGDGICVSGGAGNGLFGNFCCDPGLEFLVCNQQFRYAVSATDQINCIDPTAPDQSQPEVDCTNVSLSECNELCRQAISKAANS